MVLFKNSPYNTKPLRTTTSAIVASSVTIGSSTITPSGAQSLADRVLDTYYMQNSEIESTPIGITAPASANFTNLTTGTAKGLGFPVTFYGSSAGTSSSWDPKLALWKVNSGGLPSGGLQSDNLLLQGNALKAVNKDNTGAIYLQPQTNVVIPTATVLKFDGAPGNTGSGITSDNTGALHLTSAKCLKLEPTIAVTIPTGIPLLFDGTCFVDNVSYRSGIVNDATTSRLIVGGQAGINLSSPPSGSINLVTPAVPLVFGPNNAFPSLVSDSTGSQLTASANAQLNLSSPNVLLPMMSRLSWGSMPNQTYIDTSQGFRMVNTVGDVGFSANGNVLLGPANDIIIPGNQDVVWRTINSMIGPDNQNRLAITTQSTPIVLDSGTAQSVVINGLQPIISLGNSGNQIASSPTNITISTPKTAGDSIVVASPEIIFQGHVVFQGSATTIESTNVQTQDPVIEVGVGLPAGDVEDRGHISAYGNGYTAYWGYQPKTNVFAFLQNATDDGSGHYVGQAGTIQSAALQLTTGTISSTNNGPIQFNAANVGILNNAPFYLNPNLQAGYQYNATSGTIQLINLQGYTFTNGDSVTSDGQSIHLSATNNVIVDSNRLSFGSGPSISTTSNALDVSNISSLNLPASTSLTSGSVIIQTDETNQKLSLTATNTINLQTVAVTGPAKWNAAVIDLQYGGTGNSVWNINGGICYVDTAANKITQSTSFLFSESTSSLIISLSSQGTASGNPSTTSATINAAGVSLQQSIQAFTFSNGLYCFGTSPTTQRPSNSSNTALYLDASYTANLNGCIFHDDSRLTSIQGHADTGFLDLKGAVVRFSQSAIQAAMTSTPLSVLSPLSLESDANGQISWSGIAGLQYSTSTNSLTLSGSGLRLPTGQSNGLIWNNGNGWYENQTGLNFQGTSLNIPAQSQIQFVNGVTLNNNTWSSLSPLRLQIPQVIIDGNLRILGTTTEVISQTSILDDQFLQIGKGRLLQVTNASNYGMSSGMFIIAIITSTPHYLNNGDSIQLINLDCTPDIEGSYSVLSVLSTTSFSITVSTSLTTSGSQGTVRAPEISDSALDVGIQLNRFGTSAFMFYQHSSQQFIFYSSAVNNNDIIQSGTLAVLQCQALNVAHISGFSLDGPLIAGVSPVSGSNFQISGGSLAYVSLDQWTTTTTTIIANLNAEYLQGHHATDFVWRDGSKSMLNDWNASTSYKITSGTFAAVNLKDMTSSSPSTAIENIVFADASGTLQIDTASAASSGYRYTYYDPSRHTIVSSLDVSNPINNITFRDQQIPGSKVGPGLANCNIAGNAATVTNGVYITDYATTSAVVVSSPSDQNQLQSIQLSNNTFLANINGTVAAYNLSELQSYLGVYRSVEIIYASPPGTVSSQIIDANIDIEITKLKIPDRSTTGIDGPATYLANLPPGMVEGQTKTVRCLILNPGDMVNVTLTMVTPDINGRIGEVYFQFINSGQSATLQWDNDLKAWYQNSSGMDIFVSQ